MAGLRQSTLLGVLPLRQPRGFEGVGLRQESLDAEGLSATEGPGDGPPNFASRPVCLISPFVRTTVTMVSPSSPWITSETSLWNSLNTSQTSVAH
jgi:hypothetical protein